MPIPSIPGTCGLYVGANVQWKKPIFKYTRGTVDSITENSVRVRYHPAYGLLITEAECLSILLDDWQSMCFAARYLATRHGLNPGDTAPLWTFEPVQPAPRDLDGAPFCEDSPEMWTLVAGDGAIVFVDVDSTLPEGAPSWYPDDWIVIPGITKMGAAEALAAAINALP